MFKMLSKSLPCCFLKHNHLNIADLNSSISRTEKKTINLLKKTISENNDPNIQNNICKS